MYEIELTQDALKDLRHLKKFEQQQIVAGIEAQLQYEPAVETRNRKRLRPNDVAEWELRLGRFRVFYDVNTVVQVVCIEAIGYKEGWQSTVYSRQPLSAMKTVQLTLKSPDPTAFLATLLQQAEDEALILQTSDGREFVLAQVDTFAREIELTRQNPALMALLDQRGHSEPTVKLSQLKAQLDL